MAYRRFGKTEEMLSVITLGGMRYIYGWDGQADDIPEETLVEAMDSIQRALDCGINHIETAMGYHRSEKTYGLAFEKLNLKRDGFYLMTKGYPANAGEVRPMVEKQLELLKTDYVDFYAWHGLNNEELFDQACGSGKAVEELLKLKEEGVIKHVGFSTHAPVEVICRAIDTDLFDFVNLHYYYFFQRNRSAVDLAERKDMGVFIISPNDKGGQLFNPSAKLANLTLPYTPIQFNARWCLKTQAVHTLSFGMHQPSHFEEMQGIFPIQWPLPMVDRAIEQQMNAQYLADPYADYLGYDMQDDPSGMNIPEYLRLLKLYKCFDLLDFGIYRYNMFDPEDHWVHGTPATEENLEKMDTSKIPKNIDLKKLLREAHHLFYNESEEKR